EEDRRLVLRVLVQPDLADAQDARMVEELGDHLDDLPRELDVLRLLGIDAEPGAVLDLVEPRPVPFELDELAEVIPEPLRTRAVEPRPERRLAHQHAAGQRHPLVVVGRPGDHVDVGVDELHESLSPYLIEACRLSVTNSIARSILVPIIISITRPASACNRR